jgi:hypothetical protein
MKRNLVLFLEMTKMTKFQHRTTIFTLTTVKTNTIIVRKHTTSIRLIPIIQNCHSIAAPRSMISISISIFEILEFSSDRSIVEIDRIDRGFF